jgi:hypothetical protein
MALAMLQRTQSNRFVMLAYLPVRGKNFVRDIR